MKGKQKSETYMIQENLVRYTARVSFFWELGGSGNKL